MTPFTTSTGLQIGRCYIAPPMRVQGDAVAIQSALLAKRSKPYDPDRLPVIVGLVGIAAALLFGVFA